MESSFVGLVRGDRGGNGEVLKKSFCFFSFLFFGFDELERVEDGTSVERGFAGGITRF